MSDSTMLHDKDRSRCPACGVEGETVRKITLTSLLKPGPDRMVGVGPYRFCVNPTCAIVYFAEGEGGSFGKSDLTVRVGAKEAESPRTVCYCFNHTIEEIEQEVAETGTSQIPNSITQKCREGFDRCEETNPKGSCCLGNVRKALKEAKSKFGKREEVAVAAVGDRTEDSADCCATEAGFEKAAEKGTMNVGRWATVGTLFAAILSSACCWLPLLLISVGVSGVAFSSTLQQYRPLFATITFAFLGAAFYFTNRPNRRALVGKGNSGAESCCAEAPQEKDCCSPESGGKRFSIQKFNKAMLWVVTAFALAFVFFPNYVGAVLGGSGSTSESSDIQKAVFRIEGMSCEGCAVTVRKAIENVPSVSGAEVDCKKGEAVVGIPRGASIPTDLISKSVEDARYKATFLGSQEDRSWVDPNSNERR